MGLGWMGLSVAWAGWTREVTCDPAGEVTLVGLRVQPGPGGSASEWHLLCEVRDPATGEMELLYDNGAGLPAPTSIASLAQAPDGAFGFTLAAGPGQRDLWVVRVMAGSEPCSAMQGDLELLRLDKQSGKVLERGPVHTDQSDCAVEGRASIDLDEENRRLHIAYTRDVAGQQEDLWVNALEVDSGLWGTPSLAAGGADVQNHAVLAVDRTRGGERAIVYHDDAVPGEIALRLDDVAELPIDTLALHDDGGQGNFPFLAASEGALHVVWAQSKRIWYRGCLGSGAADWADCDELSEWTAIVAATPQTSRYEYEHPQLAVDEAGDVFLLYEQVEPATRQRRVRLTALCGPGRTLQASAHQLVDGTRGDEEIGERSFMGMPSLAVDEVWERLVITYVREPGKGEPAQGLVASRPIAELCD